MTREEELCRRLCEYLDVNVLVDGHIKFVPAVNLGEFAPVVAYDSWHDALFGCLGQFGLCNLQAWLVDKGPWLECKTKAFRFGSLDELELKLAVRGF